MMDQSARARNLQHVVQRFGNPAAKFLDKCGFAVNKVEFLNAHDLALYLALDHSHKERLGLTSDELLAVLLASTSQHQWFHSEIRRRIRQHERLDRTAALILSNDADILTKCAESRPDPDTGYRTTLVVLGLNDIRKPGSEFPLLEKAFHEQAFAVDHFDCRIPVTGDNLFGRHQLVTQIESDLRSVGRPIGLFGLRRVGKSSVLRQVLSQLRSSTSPTFGVAFADLQLHSYNATADRIASAMYRDLSKFAESVDSRFREAGGAGFDRVEAISRFLINKGHRVVLAIDEIEWLIPPDDRDVTRWRDFLSVMGSLRGLKHEHGEKLGLIVCGINESFTEMGTVLGMPNPVLDFFSSRYVGGLARSDFDKMLRSIGHRMGVSFAPNFLFEAFKQFGGHPYFSRQFCSVLIERKARPLFVRDDVFGASYDAFVREKSSLLDQVMDYFRYFYPREHETLVAIANGSARKVVPRDVKHLEAYGLVHVENNSPQIKVDAIKKWLQEKRRENVINLISALPDRFEFIEELGGGATAKVYRAKDKVLDEERAIKVYFDEVEPLSVKAELGMLHSVRSPYVVRAYDVVPNDRKQLCMVMEYVPGRSLEEVLRDRKVLKWEQVAVLCSELMDAVESIHPDLTRIEQLSQLPEFTPSDLQEYMRLRSSGHLHRDIKPGNIIVEDEQAWRCRLVDLGLTRRAADVGITRVGTEAYAPPDWGGARWDASFDLYAIGVIVFRALFGELPVRDANGNIPLAEAHHDTVGTEIDSFLQRALGSTSNERFRDVREMRKALQACIEKSDA